MADGDTFVGSEAATYAREFQLISGAPGHDVVDYLASDPRFRSARGAEEAVGLRSGGLEAETATATGLYNRLETEDLRMMDRRLGAGKGGVNKALVRLDYAMSRLFGNEEENLQVLGSGDESAIRTRFGFGSGDLPSDLLKDIRDHVQEQSEMMRHDSPPIQGRTE